METSDKKTINDFEEFDKITSPMWDNSTLVNTDIHKFLENKLKQEGYEIPEKFSDYVDLAVYIGADKEVYDKYFDDFDEMLKSAENREQERKNSENLSKSDNLGKIEITKDQLSDLKPQLKELKDNGLIEVKTSDTPNKVNVFFNKENRETVEKTINSAPQKQTKQTAQTA
jgi:hypothetical protein